MRSPSATLSWRILGLVIAGALLVAGVAILQPSEFRNHAIGIVFGTLLQHTLLAATWVGMGPGPLRSRFRWSLMWVAFIAGSFGIAILVKGHAAEGGYFAALLFTLWVGGQIPAWILARWFRVQIALPAADASGELLRSQFSLRHLMLFTLLICLLLGAWRMVVSSGINFRSRDFQAMALLCLAQALLHFPLAMGALLRRAPVAGIAIGLLYVAAMTIGEIEGMRYVTGGGVRVVATYWKNGVAAVWTLAFALAVRSCGYRLVIMNTQPVPLPGDRI